MKNGPEFGALSVRDFFFAIFFSGSSSSSLSQWVKRLICTTHRNISMLIEIPDYVLNLVANSEIKMILPSHRRMAEPIMIFVKIRFQHRLSHTHTQTHLHMLGYTFDGAPYAFYLFYIWQNINKMRASSFHLFWLKCACAFADHRFYCLLHSNRFVVRYRNILWKNGKLKRNEWNEK